MRLSSYSKALSFVLLIVLVLSCNTSMAFADTGITYPNSQYLIEKLSHPASGEGQADGILPEAGDRSNSYTWVQTQLGDYLYLGSNRNILAGTFLQAAGGELDADLVLHFLDDISNGDIPTDKAAIRDSAARVFRYDLKKKSFEEIYQSQAITGYRGALTYKPVDAEKASAYLGCLGSKARVLRFGDDFEVGDTPETVFESDTGYTSVRAMAQHGDAMCIGVLTISSDNTKGSVQIMQSTSPAIDNWTEIATNDDFAACAPRTDMAAAGQCGVWDMISYGGSLYAFIGTGYVDGSENNGYCVYKGTYLPGDEDCNEFGWVWKMIVGPLTDENGVSTGAIYPRGMGNPYDGSASPFLYTDPNGKTYVYVGTFDSIFDSIFEILRIKSYKSVYYAMHPAKVYRFAEDDKWEMVIGNPDEITDKKLGNYYAGFSNSAAASIYSPNLYIWRMAQYNGELFVGTLDASTLLDIIVPPLDIDFDTYDDDDLLAVISMSGIQLPEPLMERLTEALKNDDITSAAAVEAKKVYDESSAVLEIGNMALEAANTSCGLAVLSPGSIIEKSGDLYDAINNCAAKAQGFADSAAAAAANTPLAATTAALSQTAAANSADLASYWDDCADNSSPYSIGIADNIVAVREDILTAVDAAKQYNELAAQEASSAAIEAASAAAIVQELKGQVVDLSGKLNAIYDSVNASQYSQISDFIRSLDGYGYSSDQLNEIRYILELRVMINTTKEANDMGCSVYRTSDGVNFTPVTTNGFNDKYNYGLRSFLSSANGLFMGTANPFYGAQLWRLGDIAPANNDNGGGGNGGGSGGSGGGGGGGSDIIAPAVTSPAVSLGLLNMNDHFAYIKGYEDGTIKPMNNMTRAEVATIFYRLLTETSKAQYLTTSNAFSDVSSADWFNTAVSTLAKAGVLAGYNDGTFRPNAIITRAEFASIMAGFADSKTSASSGFTDTIGHWAKEKINTAYANGWISGYSDDTFRPNQPITRAEVATIINRALQRAAKAGNMLDGMKSWSDNPQGNWYYEAIQEATNSHNYKRTAELVPGQSYYYEMWTELTKNPD